MKILIVSQSYWPETFRINDLAAGLVERGHKIDVLTGIPNYPFGNFFPNYGLFKNRRQQHDGVTIRRVPLIPRGKGGSIQLALNYLSFAIMASIFGPFLFRGKYDAIFVFQTSPVTVGIPALVMKIFKRCPLLFWVQDLWPESVSATGHINSPFLLNIIRKLVRLIYSKCDRILIQSRSFSNSVANNGALLNNIVYYPNSAEALYRPIPVSAELENRWKLPSGFRVIFAGNIGIAQDFETIIAAAELMRDEPIQWILIGEGSMKNWIETQLIERGLSEKVHMLGRHPVESMPEFFALADVLLVSLKRDPIFSLTIPSKVQSYMACGRPILASLEGEGARLIEEAQAGLVSPPEDPQALVSNIRLLASEAKETREQRGTNGRQYYLNNFERESLLIRLEKEMLLCRKGIAYANSYSRG